MSVDLLALGFKVETAELKKGQRELDNLGTSAKKAGGSLGSMGNDADKATKQTGNLIGSLKTLAGAYVGLAAVSKFVSLSDQFTKYTAQLKLSTRSQEEYNTALSDVRRIATTAQADLALIGVLYSRINNSLRELGVTQAEVSRVTETVGLALKVSGATATESASAMLQLSQAFGSGVLRGEEFNAVNEAAPALMRALAESIGVPIGALRNLASDGRITSEVMLKAFSDPALIESYREQAKEVQTISGAMTVLSNKALEMVGVFSTATNSSNILAGGIKILSNNMDVLLSVLGAIAAFFATKGLIVLVTALAAAVATVSAPILLLAAAVTGLATAYLYFRDHGTKSIDDLVKKEKELQHEIAFSKITLANRGKVPYLEKELKATQMLIEKQRELGMLEKNPAKRKDIKGLTEEERKQERADWLKEETNKWDQQQKLQKDAIEKAKARQKELAAHQEDLEAEVMKRSQLRNSVEREYEEKTAKFYNLLEKTKSDDIEKTTKAKEKQAKEFFELDQKYDDILNKAENKALDKKYKAEIDAAKKANDEIEKQHKEFWGSVESTAHKVWTDVWQGGSNAFKNIGKTIKSAILDMLYQITVKKWIIGISASVTGGASGAASAAGGFIDTLTGGGGGGASGGSSGSLGNLTQAYSLFKNGIASFQTNFASTIADFGNYISGSGMNSLGNLISTNSTLISNALPWVGALAQLASGDVKGASFTAAGAAIGTWVFPVIGTALGALIGSVVGMFFGGKKDYKRYGTSVSGVKVGDDKFKQTGTGVIYDRKIAGVESSLSNINESFSNTLSTLFKAFDINSTIGTSAGMYQRGKSKKSGGIFNANIDGVNIGQLDVVLKKASLEQVYKALVEKVFGEGLVRAIQASSLSSGIKSLFDGMTKKEQVAGLITATMNLQGAQAELASRFGITVDQSAQVAKSTGLMGDALVAFVNKLSSAAMAFQTLGDGLINVKTGLLDVIGNSLGTVATQAVTKMVARQVQVQAPVTQSRTFSMAGGVGGGGERSLMDLIRPAMQTVTKTVYDSVTEYVDTITPITATLPTTLKGFDDLLKSINKNSSAGIKQFQELFVIRDQFIQFTQAIDGLKGNVKGALFGIVSDAEKQQMLNADLATLFGDLGREVPSSIQDLIALGKSIDYTTAEGLNLAAVFPSLVSAFNTTQNAVESLMNSLRDTSSFKTLVDFNRYKGVANNYGNTFANSYVDNLPSFATGTNMLPSDMTANVHAGERIIPAADNTAIIQALRGGSDSETKQLLRQLITEVRAGNIPLIQAVQKTAKVMQRIDDEGIMINETNNEGLRTVLDTRVVV